MDKDDSIENIRTLDVVNMLQATDWLLEESLQSPEVAANAKLKIPEVRQAIDNIIAVIGRDGYESNVDSKTVAEILLALWNK